jgi:alkaline phosphatase D
MPDTGSPLHDRRTLLRRAFSLAGSAGLAGLPWPSLGQVRLPANPFVLGVASGSPTHDSVVLWTRLTGPRGLFGAIDALDAPDVPVRWELADDERFARVLRSGQTVAAAALGHAVHVEVDGLAPDRWYYYRFTTGAAESPTGRTRTFPAPGAAAARLRLAYASCQRWEHGHYAAWRHLREDDPDAVLFLGDYIYEYPGATGAVRHTDGRWVLSLDDYRRRYALYRSDPALQAMHAACPWLLTWDDHEVQNDHAGDQPGDSGPPAENFLARRAQAYQAWYEHMPVRASVLTRALAGLAAGAPLRIHGSVAFGTLARIVLLDPRQHRDPQACGPAGKLGSSNFDPAACAAWADPARSMLGAQQERWLEEALAQPGGVWTVIGQSTLFGQRDLRAGPGQRLWNDGWDGYPAARRRLTDTLQRTAASNPVVLGGDVHENWVGQVQADYADPRSAAVGVEFCGTSITSRSGGSSRTAERLAENPHFVFADAERKGYGLCEFTPGRLTTTLRVVDDPRVADSGISTLARFTVQAGRAEVLRD